MSRTLRTLIAVTLAGLGCSSSGNVSLGGNQNPGQMANFAGNWEGYAESHTFQPSGSDRVRLVLDANGNGTVQVGDDALLPPPTDPNVGYPPADEDPTGPIAGSGGNLTGGVLLPVYAPQLQADGFASRIQFGLKPLDYYGAWCALQTPVYSLQNCSSQASDAGTILHTSYGYGVLPGQNGTTTMDSSGNQVCAVAVLADDCSLTWQPADCGKVKLFDGRVCDCTATACISHPVLPAGTAPSGYPVEFDGTLDSTGKMLTGTLAGVTVHLQRQ